MNIDWVEWFISVCDAELVAPDQGLNQLYLPDTDIGVLKMEKLSLQTKKAWFAKHRKANFAASLRLEGFVPSPNDGDIKLPTREAALKAVRHIKV